MVSLCLLFKIILRITGTYTFDKQDDSYQSRTYRNLDELRTWLYLTENPLPLTRRHYRKNLCQLKLRLFLKEERMNIVSRKISDLFGSMRITLPQYREEILRMNVERGLVNRPDLDDTDFDEACSHIYDSKQYDYAVSVKWFKEMQRGLGILEEDWGVVKEIDVTNRRFKLVSDWDSKWIRIDDIVSATK